MRTEQEIRERIAYCKKEAHEYACFGYEDTAKMFKNLAYELQWVLNEDEDVD